MNCRFVVILTLLFVWNSVFGGTNSLVLCLHSGGEAHVEIFGKDIHVEENDCAGLEATISVADCPPCTDIVLGSVDIGSIRPNELGSVQIPQLAVASAERASTEPATLPHLALLLSHPKRGPPEVEPASQLVSRVIVLRL